MFAPGGGTKSVITNAGQTTTNVGLRYMFPNDGKNNGAESESLGWDSDADGWGVYANGDKGSSNDVLD